MNNLSTTIPNFNLANDSWIKVIDQTGNTQTVSMIKLFQNTKQYRQLANESIAANVSILRLLLAVLATVYSRVDYNDNHYEELDDYDPDDLPYLNEAYQQTWRQLWQDKHFTNSVVSYLKEHENEFNFFSDHTFGKIPNETFNELIDKPNAKIKIHQPSEIKYEDANLSGTIAPGMLSLASYESNNKANPFRLSENNNNHFNVPQFIRNMLTMMQYTTIQDKLKLKIGGNNPGWMFQLSYLYAKGNNLFETLMLNLVLCDEDNLNWSPFQKPLWETDLSQDNTRLNHFINGEQPDNYSEIYTYPSRLYSFEWTDRPTPVIHAIKLLSPDLHDFFLEPDTTWAIDKSKSNKDHTIWKPGTHFMGNVSSKAWEHFERYVPIFNISSSANDDKDTNNHLQRLPGLVNWLMPLHHNNILKDLNQLDLYNYEMIYNSATSKMAVATYYDNISINAAIALDKATASYWNTHIENEIKKNQALIDFVYKNLAFNIAKNCRNLNDIATHQLQSELQERFLTAINPQFKSWLASLKPNDERNRRINEWHQTINQIAHRFVENSIPIHPSDISPSGDKNSIFIYINRFLHYVHQTMPCQKGGKP